MTCAALTSSRPKRSSIMVQSESQYTPVLSSAAWVTPRDANHAASRSRSSVIVPNVRTSFSTPPPGPGTIRQATTLRLWTSNPQHRSSTTCIGPLRVGWRSGGVPPSLRSLLCVLPRRERQSVAPGGTRAKLMDGLAAPKEPGLRAPDRPTSAYRRPAPIFIPRWPPLGRCVAYRKLARLRPALFRGHRPLLSSTPIARLSAWV